ncbi:hypothetical protein SKAU_G00410350 [Synaphobranchus kaupii]|uniref:Uncharacterized protein n=1 Tax=Synaphobranchus kaupii TaxID=118154 RepID=A0A9Q1E7M4_SYNKA|nr:hypothetical protein SKAU_G00410350 [Synaphobranchus kaupii]
MDSADRSQLKSVLAQQGVLLGQHKTQLDSLSRTLKTFAGSMNHLTAQFQQFQLGREATLSNPVPAPQASGSVPGREPHLPPPGPYADGNVMDTELVSQLHLTSIPIQNQLEALAITGAPLVRITHPSRFFFVGKKDGGLRPCIDYRGINAITNGKSDALSRQTEASEEPTERDTNLPSHCWVAAALWDIEALIQSARQPANTLVYILTSELIIQMTVTALAPSASYRRGDTTQ